MARALDLVGDRWALLIVRELLLGPKRFHELRRGLPGAGPSVLAQRLADLEGAGVLRHRQLGPPVSAAAYELTGRGRDLEPVLLALGRWGSRTPATAPGDLSVDALALALRTTFAADTAGDLAATCELRVDGDVLLLAVAGGTCTVTRGAGRDPDVVLEAGAGGLRRMIFGGVAPEAAGVTVHGDRELVAGITALFPRPAVTDAVKG